VSASKVVRASELTRREAVCSGDCIPVLSLADADQTRTGLLIIRAKRQKLKRDSKYTSSQGGSTLIAVCLRAKAETSRSQSLLLMSNEQISFAQTQLRGLLSQLANVRHTNIFFTKPYFQIKCTRIHVNERGTRPLPWPHRHRSCAAQSGTPTH
jgi:hypothetical protein